MATAARRLPWYVMTGQRLTVLGIVGMFLFGAVGVVWGAMFPARISVQQFDAGPESAFAIGKVVPFPEPNIYVVGLADGRLRAVDGVVRSTRCSVQFWPNDPRGAQFNPNAAPGVLVDPCSGAIWAVTGDAVAGTSEPLRTFSVMGVQAPDGTRHVQVEVIGERHPGASSQPAP